MPLNSFFILKAISCAQKRSLDGLVDSNYLLMLQNQTGMESIQADIAVIGGGLGGCSAALAASRAGYRVILTEESPWIGGQLTSQAVPPDEHPWIETFGATASYRLLRNGIRTYYRSHLPLTGAAQRLAEFNPGNGFVSKLCHDPRVSLAVLEQMLASYALRGSLRLMRRCVATKACTSDDHVQCVEIVSQESGREYLIDARYFIDATPLGELLVHAKAEHIFGGESSAQTQEPHAPDKPDPLDQQAFTFCFAMEHRPGEDHTIERPREYDLWRNYRPPNWPGRLLSWEVVTPSTNQNVKRTLFEESNGYSWWTYRRILDRTNFVEGFASSDITLVDWPQNDYSAAPLCGVDDKERLRNLESARQLSLSLLYWLQTEAPRPDGGLGYPGLQVRSDVVGGTADGLALAPYIRSSRRFCTEFTVVEQQIAYPLRPKGPELYKDSVGIGCYRIDLHPRANGKAYLDLGAWPFQIPLGSLIPVRIENLLPGGKNLGTSNIANGAFRLHPVEWSVGEAAGLLASFCLLHNVFPREVRHRASLLCDFQAVLRREGIELDWPSLSPV